MDKEQFSYNLSKKDAQKFMLIESNYTNLY